MTFKNAADSRAVAAAIAIALATSSPAVTAQSGPVILESVVGTPGQFSYAFADPAAPSDGQWVAIDFHRDRACPELAGFNLLLFVDVPNALACPLTVDVKEWWDLRRSRDSRRAMAESPVVAQLPHSLAGAVGGEGRSAD